MTIEKSRLDKIFIFIEENKEWNRRYQNFEYIRRLSYCSKQAESRMERLHELLRSTSETQSQPKMDYLGEFWKKIYNYESSNDCSMNSFVQELISTGDDPRLAANGPWENLYMGLRNSKGWGQKTAALFVKNVIRIHHDKDLQELWFWENLPSVKNDKLFLPVDSVIKLVFEKLGMKRPDFMGINNLLHENYESEQMLIWDDLWYWGFFTQVVINNSRHMSWNSNKFWCQISTPKDKEAEVRKIAEKFIKLIND